MSRSGYENSPEYDMIDRLGNNRRIRTGDRT